MESDDPAAVMGGLDVLKQREVAYYLGARFLEGGAVWVYGASGVMLLVSLIMMLRVKRRPRTATPSTLSWVAVLEGLRIVRRWKTVLGAISLDLFAVLFGGATAILPVYTQNVSAR